MFSYLSRMNCTLRLGGSSCHASPRVRGFIYSQALGTRRSVSLGHLPGPLVFLPLSFCYHRSGTNYVYIYAALSLHVVSLNSAIILFPRIFSFLNNHSLNCIYLSGECHPRRSHMQLALRAHSFHSKCSFTLGSNFQTISPLLAFG